MRIAVLGARGPVGREAVRAAVVDGHQVVAYARRPDEVEAHDGVSVIGGALEDVAAITEALRGCDALVVALPTRRVENGFLARVLPGVADAARAAGVPRVVHCSTFGVGETRRLASWRAQGFYRTLMRAELAEQEAGEAATDTSGLAWTTVLPIRLRDGMPLSSHALVPVQEVRRVVGLPLLPYANVGRALVDLAASDAYVGERVVLSIAGAVRLRPSARGVLPG